MLSLFMQIFDPLRIYFGASKQCMSDSDLRHPWQHLAIIIFIFILFF